MAKNYVKQSSDVKEGLGIEAIERVVQVLIAAPPDGLTMRELAVQSQLHLEKARRCAAVVAERVPYHPSRSGGFYQRWVLRTDYQAQLEERRGNPSATRRVVIDGMCADCSCKPTPSDFAMKDGRPVLPQCPRATAQPSPFAHRAADPSMTRTSALPVTPSILHRRRLLHALRATEEAQTMDELCRRTGLNNIQIGHALTTLLLRGAVIKLIRTRPGRAGIAAFAVPGAVPDPLKAS